MQDGFTVRTSRARDVVDVTARVAEVVRRAGVREGICTAFVRHTTCGLVVNEVTDAGFRKDLVSLLEKAIPDGIWEHDKIDDNGASHLQAALLQPSQAIPIRDGALALGTWQGVALVECDGPRERQILVDVRG